jgi:hypothetical protein
MCGPSLGNVATGQYSRKVLKTQILDKTIAFLQAVQSDPQIDCSLIDNRTATCLIDSLCDKKNTHKVKRKVVPAFNKEQGREGGVEIGLREFLSLLLAGGESASRPTAFTIGDRSPGSQ